MDIRFFNRTIFGKFRTILEKCDTPNCAQLAFGMTLMFVVVMVTVFKYVRMEREKERNKKLRRKGARVEMEFKVPYAKMLIYSAIYFLIRVASVFVLFWAYRRSESEIVFKDMYDPMEFTYAMKGKFGHPDRHEDMLQSTGRQEEEADDIDADMEQEAIKEMWRALLKEKP